MYLSHLYKATLLCVAAGSVAVLVTLELLASGKFNSIVEKTTESVPQQDTGRDRAPEQTPSTSDSASLPARPKGCNPTALGTSRTIFVDPQVHSRIGAMSYPETLPLRDKEVVLTFDDGPERPNTGDVLDILASECVRATFFIVGRMAKIHPKLVRRAVDEGHTVGTHTMNHPLHFRALPFDRARQEIEAGIQATSAALGDPTRLAPFFRFPGFGRTEAAEQYLASRGLMVWSADFPADDWRKISPEEVARRALSRLEEHGKGVLLLHDIHKRTVEALPIIFEALKAWGYHVVHVRQAAPEQPTTPTTADQRRPRRELKSDPSALLDHTNVGGTVAQ
jgi:peptidoglycan/xylan/chitin deacetylase (PgdA/CDA1 family)